MVEKKRFKKKCPYCNRNIASPWKKQLDFNYRLHVEACEKKAKIREEKNRAREKKSKDHNNKKQGRHN